MNMISWVTPGEWVQGRLCFHDDHSRTVIAPVTLAIKTAYGVSCTVDFQASYPSCSRRAIRGAAAHQCSKTGVRSSSFWFFEQVTVF